MDNPMTYEEMRADDNGMAPPPAIPYEGCAYCGIDARQLAVEGHGPTCPKSDYAVTLRRAEKVKQSNPKDAIGVAKVPMSTVPATVTAELGLAMMEGALKYGRHNYRAIGVRASVYYDALQRHAVAWWEGEDLDPDSQLSHITKAIATLTVLRDAMIQNKWVDDRPPAAPQGWLQELNKKAKALLEKYPEPKAPYTETGK